LKKTRASARTIHDATLSKIRASAREERSIKNIFDLEASLEADSLAGALTPATDQSTNTAKDAEDATTIVD
jgi:hypothetical protein